MGGLSEVKSTMRAWHFYLCHPSLPFWAYIFAIAKAVERLRRGLMRRRAPLQLPFWAYIFAIAKAVERLRKGFYR